MCFLFLLLLFWILKFLFLFFLRKSYNSLLLYPKIFNFYANAINPDKIKMFVARTVFSDYFLHYLIIKYIDEISPGFICC